MNTKLTLTIKKEVIETAKEYAKEKGQSLSEMVENYSKLITVNRRKIKPKQLFSKVRKLRGIIKTNEPFDYRKALTSSYWRKLDVPGVIASFGIAHPVNLVALFTSI